MRAVDYTKVSASPMPDESAGFKHFNPARIERLPSTPTAGVFPDAHQWARNFQQRSR
jgi:hypothetical protein